MADVEMAAGSRAARSLGEDAMPRDEPALRQPKLAGFNVDPAHSYTLSAPYYREPEVLARERDAIFFKSWIFIGHGEKVAHVGDYFTHSIFDQDILVIRAKDQRIRAFYNVCAHRAHELLQGEGNAKVITCPYHAWSYHADGSLRSARGSEKVAGFDKDEFCLKEVQIESFLGFLFVNLDPAAPPLAVQSGDLAKEVRGYVPDVEELTFSRRLTFDLKANWNNVVDNYLECYHCPPAHPAFSDLIDIKKYRSITHGIYSSHIGPMTGGDNKAYKFDAARQDSSLHFSGWYLWPNITLNTFPGCPNLSVLQIIPTGPETCREYWDFYFSSQEPNDEERAAVEYVDRVLQPEDIGLVESVQRGLRSKGYHQGRYIVDAERSDISEHALHHFHSLVLNALGD
jgi:choline monooxygenase